MSYSKQHVKFKILATFDEPPDDLTVARAAEAVGIKPFDSRGSRHEREAGEREYLEWTMRIWGRVAAVEAAGKLMDACPTARVSVKKVVYNPDSTVKSIDFVPV